MKIFQVYSNDLEYKHNLRLRCNDSIMLQFNCFTSIYVRHQNLRTDLDRLIVNTWISSVIARTVNMIIHSLTISSKANADLLSRLRILGALL